MIATLNTTEREIMILLFARQSIHAMVNRRSLDFSEEESEQFVIRPESEANAELFNIRLIDLLSPIKGISGNVSLLGELGRICQNPQLESLRVEELQSPIKEINEWLAKEVTYEKIWLPSIDRELSLRMKRSEFLTICGNICKHHPFRLNDSVSKLLGIFQRTNPESTLDQAFLALGEFHQWFHEDIFYYHLTHICELLNNINWGIQYYLDPVYSNAYRQINELKYSFNYPSNVNSEIGRYYFWELMNTVRSGPIVKQFATWRHLKLRY